MSEPNDLLRGARHRLPSPGAPGEHASRAEVAEAVNAWLWRTTGKQYALDAHYLAKLERGVARWPNAAYRSGLRHVLGATDDTALGFHPPRRSESGRTEHAQPGALTAWDAQAVADHAAAITDNDLMPPSWSPFCAPPPSPPHVEAARSPWPSSTRLKRLSQACAIGIEATAR